MQQFSAAFLLISVRFWLVVSLVVVVFLTQENTNQHFIVLLETTNISYLQTEEDQPMSRAVH